MRLRLLLFVLGFVLIGTGCETAEMVQSGEIPVEDPESRENQFLEERDRN